MVGRRVPSPCALAAVGVSVAVALERLAFSATAAVGM
jgi:hypothetical protein